MIRVTYLLQRENKPDVSKIARRVRRVMRFAYQLQRENEPNINEMATAGQSGVMRFTYPLQRENEPSAKRQWQVR